MKTRVLILFAMLFAMGVIQGQDLYLTFSGSGASTSVDTVWVENLTRGEKSVVTGSQVLHLEQMVTGTEKVSANVKSGIAFSPNPMNEYSVMEFSVPASGKATITIIDLSGKEVLKVSGSLSRGGHLYRISGLKTGMHFVRVTSGRYSLTGTLISISWGGDARAEYLSTVPVREPGKEMVTPKKQEPEKKGDLSEVTMQFREGDSLKFIAASGSYRTIVIDAPDTSKTMTFDFYECIDGDGNSYPVIVTGGHIWMAENLKTTKFSDGTPIRNETDDIIWASLDDQNIAAFSWYNNNETYKNIYGGLYNNPVVSGASGKNVCPAGWHVAAEEWDELFKYLDNAATKDGEVSRSAGNLIKESGSVHWGCPDNRATNETGFTALPGGLRRPDFAHLGQRAYFWDGSQGKFILYCTNGVIGHIYGKNDYGLSVRCVRNEEEQDVKVSFEGSGASTSVASVKVENLSTGATLTLNGDQVLHLGHGSGSEGTVFMEYSAGQNLKFTGISGNYSTVMVDKPGEDKTITFNFIPCTDGDGNNYPVVKIGPDIWMAENLKATKFNDGTRIENVTGNEDWISLSHKGTPAYCWYNNDISNKATYGGLYNFPVLGPADADSKNVCPVGWHVAGHHYRYELFNDPVRDWFYLLSYLDPDRNFDDSHLVSETAGLKLKETGTLLWNCQDNIATNETGFSARPGGQRSKNDASFRGLGTGASFWGGYGITGLNCSGEVWESEGSPDYGLSIRCVKDPPFVKDIEGNAYETVEIGNQVWMKENLRTKKLNDGTPIQLITADNQAWWNSVTPAYCFYPGIEPEYHGAIYNWQSVNTGKLCPSGWRVPSNTDWTVLTDYLIENGYNYDGTFSGNKIAKAMAEPGFWKDSDVPGTPGSRDHVSKMNASRFMARAGGSRGWSFSPDSNEDAVFWSSTPRHYTGDYYYMRYNQVNAGLSSPDPGDKQAGWAVRCVRNEEEQEVNVSFAGTGASTSVASVKVENLSTGATLTLNGDQVLHLGHGSGHEGTVFMEYSAGQNLKFTGISGNYSTVMVDKPGEDKTITFVFIPCTDGDGNNYPVVKIDHNIWMAENLKTTKFSDGTPIQNVTGNQEWMSLELGYAGTPAYCWYNNDVTYKNTYGALYTASAAHTSPYGIITSDKNICPVGWQVPTEKDFVEMLMFLDPGFDLNEGPLASTIAVTKLKETGNDHWLAPNNGTNSSGFTAVPGGSRSDYLRGDFYGLGQGCFFWTDLGLGIFGMGSTRFSFSEGGDRYGFSIRCVKALPLIKDIDGNAYETVEIGSQVWMKQDLRTTKLNDGTPIQLITDDDQAWWNSVTPAYCHPFYESIYNWQSVNTGKLCPSGWRVPSNADWSVLTDYLIANGYNYDGTYNGNKIAKALADPGHWENSGIPGTPGNYDYPQIMNASRFSARSGWQRGVTFSSSSDELAVFWSSTPSHFTGYYYVISYNQVNTNLSSPDSGDKQAGWAVRCMKDK